MKNYQLLVDYIVKSKQLMVDVQPILVVDERRFMDKILEIWGDAEQTSRLSKERFMVLLKRDLDDQESLLRAFDDKEGEE